MTQPFGYKDEPGTCLWCGRKLRHAQVMAEENEPGATRIGPGYWLKRAKEAGPYQDGCFDTQGCGYQFGLRMARLGRRLQAARA
jgi:hypothetical protein